MNKVEQTQGLFRQMLKALDKALKDQPTSIKEIQENYTKYFQGILDLLTDLDGFDARRLGNEIIHSVQQLDKEIAKNLVVPTCSLKQVKTFIRSENNSLEKYRMLQMILLFPTNVPLGDLCERMTSALSDQEKVSASKLWTLIRGMLSVSECEKLRSIASWAALRHCVAVSDGEDAEVIIALEDILNKIRLSLGTESDRKKRFEFLVNERMKIHARTVEDKVQEYLKGIPSNENWNAIQKLVPVLRERFQIEEYLNSIPLAKGIKLIPIQCTSH